MVKKCSSIADKLKFPEMPIAGPSSDFREHTG
jgi:hypothetical protein